MPMTFRRYKPDHAGIAAFLHGPELRSATRAHADDVVALAKADSATLADSWAVEDGAPEVIGDYSRLTVNVVNSHRAAAAIEFGSGRGRAGSSGDRPQGGFNHPQRVLGRAGARIGDMRGELG